MAVTRVSSKAEIQDDDTGMKQLIRDLKVFDKNFLKVGIVEGNTDRSKLDARSLMWDDDKKPVEDLTIVENAEKHRRLRPYMEIGFEKHFLNIERHIAESVDNVLNGKLRARKSLMSIGKFTSAWMRVTLDVRDVLPISEARIAEKRLIGNPDNALINWGRMQRATKYRIEKDV